MEMLWEQRGGGADTVEGVRRGLAEEAALGLHWLSLKR